MLYKGSASALGEKLVLTLAVLGVPIRFGDGLGAASKVLVNGLPRSDLVVVI